MATAELSSTTSETNPTALRIGPRDSGRRMTLDEFIAAEWEPGYLYELARGIVVVTEVPRPSHGEVVRRLARLFIYHGDAYPGAIAYGAGGGECRIRLPGMASDRHPDQAIYLTRRPKGKHVWQRWVPAIVIEVVSRRGEERDYIAKRDEYHRFGVLEYWIFDPYRRKLVVLKRNGDIWAERELDDAATYRTELLPGLVVSVGEILGPIEADEDEEDESEDGPMVGPLP